MSRIWQLGNGQTLNDALIPYPYGSDAYYSYIADKRRQAQGDTGPAKSQRLQELERGLAADKTALPEWQQEQGWKDAHNANAGEYATALADYNKELALWKQGGNDFVKGMDHGGQIAAGYEKYDALGRPVASADYTGLDAASEGTLAALGGDYYKSQDPFFTGKGKMGGVGNENPATGVDNSWNDLEGQDVRTDEQKFYDRNLKNVHETADGAGTYHWYGTEVGYDPKNAAATRDVDLNTLGSRSANPAAVDAGKQAAQGFKVAADGNPYDYNNVNGYGISHADYVDQVRKRANLSTYGRTA